MRIVAASDWTAGDTGASNTSPAFETIVAAVERLIRSDAHMLIAGRSDRTARLIVAQLAHQHGLAPTATDRGDDSPPTTEPMREGGTPSMETLYEMVVDGKRTLLPLGQAGAAYDNGWVPVYFGEIVYENGDTRQLTDMDRRAISNAADEHSANK